MEKNTQNYRGISRDTSNEISGQYFVSSPEYQQWERGIDYSMRVHMARRLLRGCAKWIQGKLSAQGMGFSILINVDYESIPLKLYIELWPYPRDAQLSFKLDVSESGEQPSSEKQ